MEIVRCEKGHFYDAEQNSSCPQCAAEAQRGTSAPAGGVSGYGPTEPIGPTSPVTSPGFTPTDFSPNIPETSPGLPFTDPAGGVGATVPVTNPGFTPTDFAVGGAGGMTGAKVQAYEPTMPVPQGGVAGFNPVVGWMVCVDGPDKGTDYRIRGGNNYIGRDQSMDICIRNDNHISNKNAAIIGYDEVERQFFFGPAGGHNTVRVNGKMIINAVPLAPYDELTVGTTKLMFVPLCGERFSWNG